MEVIEFTPTVEQIIKWREAIRLGPECRCPITQALATALQLEEHKLLNAGPATCHVKSFTGGEPVYVPATDEDRNKAHEFIYQVDTSSLPVEQIKIPTLHYIKLSSGSAA